MVEIKLRKATKRDAEKIAKILVSAYNIVSIKEGKKTFLNELKKGHLFFVLVSKQEMIGLVSFIQKGLFKHGLCELDRIAVLPDYRGKNFANKLFLFGVKEIKVVYKKKNSSLRKLYLLTHTNNKRAQKFYKKIGFKKDAVLKNHYYEGTNELVMARFY